MSIESNKICLTDNELWCVLYTWEGFSKISSKRKEEQRQASIKTRTGRTGNSGETRLPADYCLNILERI